MTGSSPARPIRAVAPPRRSHRTQKPGLGLRLLATSAIVGLAGCQTSSPGTAGSFHDRAPASEYGSANDTRAWEVPRPSPSGPMGANRAGTTAATTTVLPAYAVRETAFSDFGMSVKTNFDVQWGGHVAWMVVTAIDAGSSAARQRLGVGDRILAIDGRPVTTFDRDAMLAALFHRKQGETSRLLVLGPKEALPRFVTLAARRP
jgi:hypothetical protein